MLKDLLKGLESKKFKAFLATELTTIVVALSGKVTWKDALVSLALVAIAYILGQSAVDKATF